MNKSTQSAYIPGTCNINTAEIAYRRKVGHISLIIGLGLLTVLLLLGTDRWYRLLAIPVWVIMVSCYKQARNRFCVGYGAAGQQIADENNKSAVDVGSDENKKLDKAKASKMNRISLIGGILIGALTLVIPEF
jgi:hypothetical protein